MGCPCSAKSAQNNNQTLVNRPPSPQPEDCDFTRTVIQNWYNILLCVKTSNKLGIISLTTLQANIYLGYLQSALNYPDNYCYYQVKLTDYQQNILPRIIANVPECI